MTSVKNNKDCEKVLIDYTNRRKVTKLSADSNKSNEERKMENEKEFEFVQSQIKECSISNSSSTRKSVSKKSLSASTRGSSSSSSHPEVEEFQRFLEERGGHYGGWKEKDHLFFVKTRNKYPLNKTAEVVEENFPDITREKIIAHDAWYNQYLKLKAANKRAIEEWKKNQKPPPKIEEKPKPEPKPQSAPVKRDPNVKEKIEIWKAHTLAAKLQRLEKHQEEEMRKKIEEEEKKKVQEEKRALINRYREEKLSFELAMKTAKEMEKLEEKKEAVRRAATLLKYFRYEDRRFTERQKSKKQQQVKEEPKKVKSCVEVKRDPNRLLQPTLGWIYHTKKIQDEDRSNPDPPLFIQHLRKLGKPTWRKEVAS